MAVHYNVSMVYSFSSFFFMDILFFVSFLSPSVYGLKILLKNRDELLKIDLDGSARKISEQSGF